MNPTAPAGAPLVFPFPAPSFLLPAPEAHGDFSALLQARGLSVPALAPVPGPGVGGSPSPDGSRAAGSFPFPASPAAPAWQVQATTVLAFKYADGVLVAGDRRATAGNTIVYERADKVLEIDQHTVMAIAGVPATAWEMARVLKHSFQYYRRTQLQEMTVDGKVRALSKLLRDNVGMALQGLGAVVPLFATYDPAGPQPTGRLYFYDVMGANFEVTDYAATGSGSPGVRGVLYYENTWGPKRLLEYTQEEAVALTLRALDTAADADSATGGVDRQGKIFPVIKLITQAGITTVTDDVLARLFKDRLPLGLPAPAPANP